MKDIGQISLKLVLAMYIIAAEMPGLLGDGSCPGLRTNELDAIKKMSLQNIIHALKEMALRGHTIEEYQNKGRIRCTKLCLDNDKCRSFNHDKTNGICQLNDARNVTFPGDMYQDESFSYYDGCIKSSEFTGRWPSGSYGLPMPEAGCPTADGFNWETGYRFQDTDSKDPNNKWSDGLHLKGPYGVDDMYQHFCMKTVDRVGFFCDIEWPQGEYCVFKYGDHCTRNMASGSISWDDDDSGNTNSVNGTVPSGLYDQDTRIDYCCMTSGNASQPIALPTGSPFYLFPYTAECQQVQGMTVTQEWFFWDCDGTDTAPVGSHPLYEEYSGEQYVYYCYYEAN